MNMHRIPSDDVISPQKPTRGSQTYLEQRAQIGTVFKPVPPQSLTIKLSLT